MIFLKTLRELDLTIVISRISTHICRASLPANLEHFASEHAFAVIRLMIKIATCVFAVLTILQ